LKVGKFLGISLGLLTRLYEKFKNLNKFANFYFWMLSSECRPDYRGFSKNIAFKLPANIEDEKLRNQKIAGKLPKKHVLLSSFFSEKQFFTN
jgi:hypothetical protein